MPASFDLHTVTQGDVDYVLRQCETYLSETERATLKTALKSVQGQGSAADNATNSMLTIESALASLTAQRLQQYQGKAQFRHFSILRPLSSCQNYLDHHADCMTSLATLISEGKQEYGSLQTFFEVTEGAPNPNFEAGYLYQWKLFQNKDYEQTEEILTAYIPAVDKLLGKSHPIVLGSVRLLAELKSEIGQFKQADGIMNNVEERIEAMQGDNLQHKTDEIDEWHALGAFINEKRAKVGTASAV